MERPLFFCNLSQVLRIQVSRGESYPGWLRKRDEEREFDRCNLFIGGGFAMRNAVPKNMKNMVEALSAKVPDAG